VDRKCGRKKDVKKDEKLDTKNDAKLDIKNGEKLETKVEKMVGNRHKNGPNLDATLDAK